MTVAKTQTRSTTKAKTEPAKSAPIKPAEAAPALPMEPAETVRSQVTLDPPKAGTKLDMLVQLLSRPEGATVHDLSATTGWQVHSVRGAMAGALMLRGYKVTSDKPSEIRIYRITTLKKGAKGGAAKRAAR
jgi:hypothetical protein